MSFQISDVPRCKLFVANIQGDPEEEGGVQNSDVFNRETFNAHTLYITLGAASSVEIFLSASDRPGDDDVDAMDWIKFGSTISDSAIVTLPANVRWIYLKRDTGTDEVTATLLSSRSNR